MCSMSPKATANTWRASCRSNTAGSVTAPSARSATSRRASADRRVEQHRTGRFAGPFFLSAERALRRESPGRASRGGHWTRMAFSASGPCMSLRVLTGIKPTGVPHLGNYVGAIRPAVLASAAPDVESFFFLADYHALISTHDPVRVQRSTLEIAASWLACGQDPERVAFYRQSDIPETTELTWLLTCVAGMGLLNRAHAYKAAVDRNRAEGSDDDAGLTAGLYMYPVLMAADILLFNAHRVPVGRDQVQHIEMARDFAQRFNHLYGAHFTLPEAAVEE